MHHPSYIDFFEQVLADTTDPAEIEARYELQYATDEWYRHLYRTSYAYHGVHPFYMWYWGAHALSYLGRVIVVGGDRAAVRRNGVRPGLQPQRRLRDRQRHRRQPAVGHAPAPAAVRHGGRFVIVAVS